MNPLCSIIIPAYNEAEWLPETLKCLGKAIDDFGQPAEVIVVDNNSTDETAEIARSHGAQVVFEPVNQISRARNTGARTASGNYFVFLDADTLLPENLFRAAINRLNGGGCCGGGARVALYEAVPSFVRTGLSFWNYWSATAGIAAGCFIFCLKRGFESVGGFSEQVYAGEEYWLSRRLKFWGKRNGMTFEIIDEPPIITSSRKLRWFSPLQMISILLVGAFPLSARSRSLCAFWYKRPKI
ncbi:MAG TPA: glycosyltransferase [Deltaproteobacteria bacterium]|nr:glycosyltransferase [Deltaproteobacteria bacterium]